ncbi:MAG: N-acetylglucosamine kinase, partial [Rhodothermia bacterium]
MEEKTNSICIGLDGGGTSTRMLAVDADERRWTDKDGTSNPRIVGIERASKVISGLIERAIHEFPDSKGFHVCAGIAGAATASMQRALADSIKLELKEIAGPIQLTDDVTIAYEAAFAGDPGVLFMVGTGSMVLVRTVSGVFVRSGGWGYLLGDEGSGYSIGRAG